MTKAWVVAALALAAAGSAVAETLIFSDDFNTLNLSTWKHEITLSGGGNWEFEVYLNNRSNSFVNNSILSIQPTLLADSIGDANVRNGYTMDLWGGDPSNLCTSNAFYGCLRTSGAGGNYLNPIQSARIRTAESFSFKYGRVEASIKLPLGDWLWPAFWLLPKQGAYGIWPASGEIDIMESRGNSADYAAGGVNQFGSTLHWGPFYGADGWQQTHATYTIPTGDLSQGFHTYGLFWNQTVIQTYIDNPNNVVLNVPINETFFQRGGWSGVNNPWAGGEIDAPFDQEFYIIINLAVGGTAGYFPDGVGGKPWSDTSSNAVNEFYNAEGAWLPTWQKGPGSSALQVDYVKVWSL